MKQLTPIRPYLLAFGLGLLLSNLAMGAASGEVRGVVRDSGGSPLGDLLVSLAAKSAESAIPLLTRTDETGRLLFENVQAGTYFLRVLSSAYETPPRMVQIAPGEAVSVSLVLERLLGLGTDQQNIGVKALLRSNQGRMIFRTAPLPSDVEQPKPLFEKVSFEVYANAGGGDSILSPLDFPGGTTTNFAVKRSMPGGSDFLVAGQFNSGPDSFWRVKNRLQYDLGGNHSLQFFMGYGRISLGEPNAAPLEEGFVGDTEFGGRGVGATRVVSMGFEDSLSFGEALSVVWGLELDQVRRSDSRYFVSPSAEVSFRPLEGATLRVSMASKRETRGNSVKLPAEESLNLDDAVYFSLIDDQLSVATARHYQASLGYDFNPNSSVELAAYRDQLSEAAVPYFALGEGRTVNALRLGGGQADGQGYRVTYRQRFGDNVKATVSYVHGTAAGLDAGDSLLVDPADFSLLLRRRGYHALATQIEAFVPLSRTHLTAIVKRVGGDSDPLTALDAFSDVYETSNQGVNLFVRQLIPVPSSLLNFLGLDFLASYKIEALLDVRNLTNDDLGVVRTPDGDLLLVQNPRTVRGGIALNF